MALRPCIMQLLCYYLLNLPFPCKNKKVQINTFDISYKRFKKFKYVLNPKCVDNVPNM